MYRQQLCSRKEELPSEASSPGLTESHLSTVNVRSDPRGSVRPQICTEEFPNFTTRDHAGSADFQAARAGPAGAGVSVDTSCSRLLKAEEWDLPLGLDDRVRTPAAPPTAPGHGRPRSGSATGPADEETVHPRCENPREEER